jgi:HSP20 family protein
MSNNNQMMKREETQPSTTEPHYRTIAPACDVYEDGKEFLVVAEMPGVEERSVDLRLDRTRLTIEAVRPHTNGEGLTDRTQTRYARAFEVPDTIDAANISAELRQGVLSVHLPKAPQARVRQISVKAG